VHNGTGTSSAAGTMTDELRALRIAGIQLARRAKDLEKTMSQWTFTTTDYRPALRPTDAIICLLQTGPRTKNEIVTVLEAVVASRARDRRRTLYATLGQMKKRGVVREEGENLMALA